MTIIEAIHDPNLFGPLFKDGVSWQPWWSFLKTIYGLPMEAADMERFRHHTGRQNPRPGGYPEAVCIVGCQSGKSQIAAVVGVYETLNAVVAKQRGVYVPLLAQDLRGAQRALFGYVRQAVAASPMLAAEVIRETADTMELANGITISVYPCRPASLRGIRAQCVLLDELAFFTATDGRPTDTEMLRVARTRTATTGGKVIVLSSPYAASGALWDLHRKHFAQEDSPVLVWQATAPEMNGTLPADYLQRMELDDPEAYRSEVLGEFRPGLSALFDPDALDACVEAGIRERPPEPRHEYCAFVDVASGTGSDSFAVGIAHLDGQLAVLDVIRSWHPPFNPLDVIRECALLLRRYRQHTIIGDAYSPGFTNEAFRVCGIHYEQSQLDRSGLYLELLPMVNSRQTVLLDRSDLLKELRGLERRRGVNGRDKVDHRSRQHDDCANVCAGSLTSVVSLRMQPAKMVRIVGF